MNGINEWVIEACQRRGIIVNKDGSLDVSFFGSKTQHVKDLSTAIRQQQHIVDQQKSEQEENKEIGLLMRQFHETVQSMSKMTIFQLTVEKTIKYKNDLMKILETMSKKKAELRKDGHTRLTNVLKMIDKKNLPAANWASKAALDRMRKRWLVNEKVIDKSLARLEALKQLKN